MAPKKKMKKNTSTMKEIFIEIETTNANCIIAITKKLNLMGIDIDTNFRPKVLNVSQSNAQRLILVKGRIVQSLIKRIKECPDVINCWELKSTIPFDNTTTLL